VRTPLVLTFAALIAAALAIPMVASSSSTAPADAVAQLQRRLTALEHDVAGLKRRATAQAKFDQLQLKINANTNSQLGDDNGRLLDLQNQINNKKPSISVDSGAPVSISPFTWGSSWAGCISGTPIAGGFNTTYPVMIGTSLPSDRIAPPIGPPGSWTIYAWNPSGGNSASVTPYVVCLQ
jgi:hypothetical protein